MGDSLATGTEGEKRGYGGGGGMVCPGWRLEYCASSVAVCGSGGEESEEGVELGSGGLGRYGPQDRAAHSEDEIEDTHPNAVESRGIRERKREEILTVF